MHAGAHSSDSSDSAPPGRLGRVVAPVVLAVALAGGALALARVADRPMGYSLHEHGGWLGTKALLGLPAPGGVAFLVTSQALARNRLDLGTWHGQNEVIHVRPAALGRLEAEVGVGRGARLAVVFGRDGAGFWGLELCAARDCATQLFHAELGGRFTWRRPVSPDGELVGRPHRVVIEGRRGHVSVALNGRELGRLPARAARAGGWGFRGGFGTAWVDNVVLNGPGGEPVATERFEPRRRSLLPLPVVAAAALLLGLGVFVRHRRRRFVWHLVAMAQLLLLATTAATLAVRQRFAEVYPRASHQVMWFGFRDPFVSETERLGRLDARFGADTPEVDHRVLFIGGSQTEGEGASSRARTAVERLCALLRGDAALGLRVGCLNGGLPGAGVRHLLETLFERWRRLRPDTVVLNVGFNDAESDAPGPDGFGTVVRRAVRRFRARGIDVLLVAEAARTRTPGLAAIHRTLRRLAAEEGVPFLDMDAHLRARAHDGYLWWDGVHLTDFGQELWARRASRALVPMLGRPRERRRTDQTASGRPRSRLRMSLSIPPLVNRSSQQPPRGSVAHPSTNGVTLGARQQRLGRRAPPGSINASPIERVPH